MGLFLFSFMVKGNQITPIFCAVFAAGSNYSSESSMKTLTKIQPELRDVWSLPLSY